MLVHYIAPYIRLIEVHIHHRHRHLHHQYQQYHSLSVPLFAPHLVDHSLDCLFYEHISCLSMYLFISPFQQYLDWRLKNRSICWTVLYGILVALFLQLFIASNKLAIILFGFASKDCRSDDVKY